MDGLPADCSCLRFRVLEARETPDLPNNHSKSCFLDQSGGSLGKLRWRFAEHRAESCLAACISASQPNVAAQSARCLHNGTLEHRQESQ